MRRGQAGVSKVSKGSGKVVEKTGGTLVRTGRLFVTLVGSRGTRLEELKRVSRHVLRR